MTQNPRQPGRPRESIDDAVFAATLSAIAEFGYTRATVDRIAATAGVAKTTIYRRWASRGELITAAVVDSFGPMPLDGDDLDELLAQGIRWVAAKIADPGLGAALAGLFADAINDADLREILATRLQAPFLETLAARLDAPETKVRLLMDATVGTLLQRMGITGEPMDAADVDALVGMVRGLVRG
ncbi:TetR/AcrR family transcriptional regulator [Phytomonospora endophytica]|uniref:AcrR family transcriptional regulator n=1 Tax=Phytomonospora endophytica TaxID=714109 RepID=A0A841FJY9_9ACTN|nr:TetR/AcrR family transcriptional regulator [Phytomonospora endophytica]MBB6037641.1 AcrR family transcriptional regulator [Phytomonospora endophytica]GIG67832.1 TetR family transcriptional regulator [Phytomonospora endophytica]